MAFHMFIVNDFAWLMWGGGLACCIWWMMLAAPAFRTNCIHVGEYAMKTAVASAVGNSPKWTLDSTSHHEWQGALARESQHYHYGALQCRHRHHESLQCKRIAFQPPELQCNQKSRWDLGTMPYRQPMRQKTIALRVQWTWP